MYVDILIMKQNGVVKIVEMKMIVVNGYLKIDENRNMKMVVYVCVENLLLLL